ncbi:MAG: shikimate kinase [Planctomycetaceae bacterium]|jgi:shikimate kinase|nr:shikimate kinase [Planctomycetaceae bacterium]
MRSLILIGYRGTGKTTIARKLSEQLHIPVFDSDAEIERHTGKNIADIFAQNGEAEFRNIEESTIAEILKQNMLNPFILATGGGAILRPETRCRLKNAGHVVWLTATPKTIFQRIQFDPASGTMRPNLTSLTPLEEIIALLEKRHPLYSETAHEIIETDLLKINEITNRILSNYFNDTKLTFNDTELTKFS